MLALLTKPAAKSFKLDYFGGFATYQIDVYMLRHREVGEPDYFTVHRLVDGESLGWGDTKEEAISAAKCTLAPIAESISHWRGLTEYPYGPFRGL